MAIVIWDGTIKGATGSTSNTVYAQTKYGTVIKSKPIRRSQPTPAMEEANRRFRQAVALYRTLTPAQNAAWKQFALSPLNRNPETGELQGITAYTAFVGLTTRFLTASPDADVPLLPPAYPFSGDQIALIFTGETGQIRVEASAANSAHNATELLLYRLKFPAQSVRLQDYVSAGFATFTPSSLSTTLELPAGWYGVASRFVSTTSGLWTARLLQDPVQVL